MLFRSQDNTSYLGDILKYSELKGFPLHPEDNWKFTWAEEPVWGEEFTPNEEETTFGKSSVVVCKNPVVNDYLWFVGDSFGQSLRKYVNGSFKEIRHVGHWKMKLKGLAGELERAEKKPNWIIIEMVERGF